MQSTMSDGSLSVAKYLCGNRKYVEISTEKVREGRNNLHYNLYGLTESQN
jgi:hypothetical protein